MLRDGISALGQQPNVHADGNCDRAIVFLRRAQKGTRTHLFRCIFA